METFVYVYAWILAISVVLRAICMCGAKYPRTSTINLGSDVVCLVIGIGMFAWTQYLLH